MKIQTYTVSEKHKSFVWLPLKCATHLISWVLSYFEFSSISIDTDTNQIHRILGNQTTHFGVNTILPPNHNDLSFICAIRHPYQRVLSMYQFTHQVRHNFETANVNNFEKFINDTIVKNRQQDNHTFFDFSETIKDRMPDYIIKTENLYQDLIKIPFIKESDLNNSGVLKNFCNKKINESSNKLNPEEYLTPHIKEIIYNISSDHFDLFGYEK
jgi:hypothetical protein